MKHSERGSSMVELTLAIMVFLVLMFGILEFSRALYVYHTVSNAARLGARWAIVRGSRCGAPLDNCNAQSSDVQTFVRSQINGVMDPSLLTVDAEWPGGNNTCPSGGTNNAPGCLVTVTATYQFGYALPFVSASGFRLSSTSQMIISN